MGRVKLALTMILTTGCTSIMTMVRCPDGMVYVEDESPPMELCVDKYEYTAQAKDIETLRPAGYKNREDCQRVCQSQGKRLLTHQEWQISCTGTPADKCNRTQPHPILRRGKLPQWKVGPVNCKHPKKMWSVPCMNDPAINRMDKGLAANHEFPECVSAYGVHHMVGNLGEWVSDIRTKGKRRLGRFNGGLYPQPKSTCAYTTIAHGPEYRDYSIGCRCAKSPHWFW